jgi:hypothetical protein
LLDPGRGGHQPGTRIQVGIWFQEDGGGTTMLTRPSIRCAQLLAAAVGMCPSPDSSAPAHATDLCLLSGHVRSRGLGLYTVDARANVGGRGRARHLGTAPMDCSCDALYGDTGLMALARSSMRRKFAGMTNVSTPPRGAGSVLSSLRHTEEAGRPRWELIGRRVCRRLSKGTDRAEHR